MKIDSPATPDIVSKRIQSALVKPDMDKSVKSANFLSLILNLLSTPTYTICAYFIYIFAPQMDFASGTWVSCAEDDFTCDESNLVMMFIPVLTILTTVFVIGLIGYFFGRFRWGSGKFWFSILVSLIQAALASAVIAPVIYLFFYLWFRE